MPEMIPEKTIERLSLYRRILSQRLARGEVTIFSHELAELSHTNAAQVRRDIFHINRVKSGRTGYQIGSLVKWIDELLDGEGGQRIALAGIGNLGRAFLAYFMGRRPKLQIIAAFDVDPNKVDRVISGCRCHPMEKLARVVEEEKITLGIITTSEEAAQKTADRMVEAGIRGILSMAPGPLRVPEGIYLEEADITMFIEKTAYFARTKGAG